MPAVIEFFWSIKLQSKLAKINEGQSEMHRDCGRIESGTPENFFHLVGCSIAEGLVEALLIVIHVDVVSDCS